MKNCRTDGFKVKIVTFLFVFLFLGFVKFSSERSFAFIERRGRSTKLCWKGTFQMRAKSPSVKGTLLIQWTTTDWVLGKGEGEVNKRGLGEKLFRFFFLRFGWYNNFSKKKNATIRNHSNYNEARERDRQRLRCTLFICIYFVFVSYFFAIFLFHLVSKWGQRRSWASRRFGCCRIARCPSSCVDRPRWQSWWRRPYDRIDHHVQS